MFLNKHHNKILESIIPVSVTILLLISLLSCSTRPEEKDHLPNIILIMADDIGIEGFGCYGGSSYKTPNIDNMAGKGLLFTHAYSQPLCTPTRVQLMTGKYNQRNWVCFGVFDPREKTFGHLLSEAGYKTCISGKWQLYSYDPPGTPGSAERRGTGMHPEDSGFDEYSLFHALHTEDKGSRYANPTFLRNGKLYSDVEGKYGEDLNLDFISSFMEKNKENPFFVYYPMVLPHAPQLPTPLSEEWKDPEKRLIGNNAYFPDMVEYMDFIVGKLVKKTEELEIAENTIIMFYSDNGTGWWLTSKMGNLVVPGGKRISAQSGIRVPLIAYCPGKILPGISNSLIDASDFLPTLAELAKTEIPTDWHTDGISFAPELYGEKANQREYAFFWYYPRPGYNKERFSLEVFALNHDFKLYENGRMFQISGTLPIETELDTAKLSIAAQKAKRELEKVLTEMMKPPLSATAQRVSKKIND
jgi:arylsulfatase A-like enzyme